MATVAPKDFGWTIQCKKSNEAVPRAHVLLEPLVERLAKAWRSRQLLFVEDLLDEHPELKESPEAILRLLYEEVVQRQKAGDRVRAIELRKRFPQWKLEIRALLANAFTSEEPQFPEVGDTLCEFNLLEELGQGAQGRVFHAADQTLARRAAVLKITPLAGEEHLSLARLQHTHIVPLYAVHDLPARNLRVLVFPYLGRLTWKRLMESVEPIPMEQRRGGHLLQVLIEAEADTGQSLPTSAPLQRLESCSYVEAVCRVGISLAETLHYAHQRGLVHLDVKPSNVLFSMDGQPLLLDFHLAQAPLEPGGRRPETMGGTVGYMAPEQSRVFEAMDAGRDIGERVDGRADLYALGIMLYEALSGQPMGHEGNPRPLSEVNPNVSVGLSDIIHKCLAANASDRYADGAAVAEDLRRHLEDRPLLGVRNRSMLERYEKWRRRRPYLLPIAGLFLALASAVLTGAYLLAESRAERRRAAEKHLFDGQDLMRQQRYGDATRVLARGEDLLGGPSIASPLGRALAEHRLRAHRATKAQELNQLVNTMRFLYVMDSLPKRLLMVLEASCMNCWKERNLLVDRSQGTLESEVEENLQRDLVDLVICLSDIQVRLHPDQAKEHQEQALLRLGEAEAIFGGSPVLYRERHRYATALGLDSIAQTAQRQAADAKPRNAWDHVALGRGMMRSGEYAQAIGELERALAEQPHNFWTNFCIGICATKLGRHPQALEAFSVCIGQSPNSPDCFLQRGLAFAELGQHDRARQDLTRAIDLRPDLADAYLQRGIVHQREKRDGDAIADLNRAREMGADQALTHYHLAVSHLARNDRAAARGHIEQALRLQPGFGPAIELRKRMEEW